MLFDVNNQNTSSVEIAGNWLNFRKLRASAFAQHSLPDEEVLWAILLVSNPDTEAQPASSNIMIAEKLDLALATATRWVRSLISARLLNWEVTDDEVLRFTMTGGGRELVQTVLGVGPTHQISGH